MTEIFQRPPAGSLDGGRHVLPLRVYYEDTDFSGVVYHANYLRFFERGRTEFVRALGVDQKAMHEETGSSFAVRSMAIEYCRPAMMDDIVAVETRVRHAGGSTLRLVQTLRRDDTILTTAEVLIVCVKAGRPQRLPKAMREALDRIGALGPQGETAPVASSRAGRPTA